MTDQTAIQTDPELLARLRSAALSPMAREELLAQRISWCVGQTHVPRALIEKALKDV